MAIAPVSGLTVALFTGADRNRDGSLTQLEFRKIAPGVVGNPNPSPEDIAKAFKTLDIDKSGTLTSTELATAKFTGNTLSPTMQANIKAYTALTTGASYSQPTVSQSFVSGLYGSLAPSTNSGNLAAALLTGAFTKALTA